MFESGKSPTEIGFLSPDITAMIPEYRKAHAIWFALAEDMNRTGQSVLANFTIGNEIPEQHFFGVLLLVRTLSNFQVGFSWPSAEWWSRPEPSSAAASKTRFG
jgi:hypothetical protein